MPHTATLTGIVNKVPEEQFIGEEIIASREWQTISFKEPLRINRQEHMNLHLAVNREPYISTTADHPLNRNFNNLDEYFENAFSLRRLSDGVLIRPEAELVGDNGVVVKIRPKGNLCPGFDEKIRTVILGTLNDFNSSPPPYPEGIEAFTALRIRSTESFRIQYLWWKAEGHPEPYREETTYCSDTAGKYLERNWEAECHFATQGSMSDRALGLNTENENSFFFLCAVLPLVGEADVTKREMTILRQRKQELAEKLYNKGLDIHFTNDYGDNLLMALAFSYLPEDWRLSMVENFISRGADKTQQNNHGYTALDFAKDRGDQLIIDALMGGD